MVGSKIRQLREDTGRSRAELSALTGVPINSIAGWENGKHEPNVNQAAMIAGALGISLDVLVGLKTGDPDKKVQELTRKNMRMRRALLQARENLQNAAEIIRKAMMEEKI